jgi:uncharacterized protein YciU (UPF0263 family)
MLTEEEQKEAEKYNALSLEEKSKYLEENGVVILDSVPEEDGNVKLTLEIKDEYYAMLQQMSNDGETIDDAFARVLTNFVRAHEKT